MSGANGRQGVGMVHTRLVIAVTSSVIAASAALGAAAVTSAGPAAAAEAQATVKVTIEEVTALDSLDFTDAADFYPQVYIAGQAFGGAQLEITDKDHITPDNWSFTATVSFASAVATAPVTVELYDADGGLNGPRDHVDITTGDADRDLNGTVRLLDCADKVPDIGLSGDKPGTCDRILETSGETTDKAKLKFK